MADIRFDFSGNYFNIEFNDRDVNDMWNYLSEDVENFIYTICDFISENIQEWSNYNCIKELYEKLKEIYNNE